MRQAFYFLLGVEYPMQESWPEWDPVSETVIWTDYTVHPDGKYAFLLKDSIKALNFFSEHLHRPYYLAHVNELEWNNHLFAISAFICEFFNHLYHQPMVHFLSKIQKYLKEKGLITFHEKPDKKKKIKV